jgi:hypothetical protein
MRKYTPFWERPRQQATNGGKGVSRPVHLLPSDSTFLEELAKQAQCSPATYLNELVQMALKDKRERRGKLNDIQLLATESMLMQSQLAGGSEEA